MALREDISERAERRVGTVLKGKWRLDSVLGIGGMASVYAATHRNQRRVAIKMLHPEVAVDQEVTTRFLREGYVANAVGHPGTVAVLDDDLAEDGAPFLVMELLLGRTLDALLDDRPDGLEVASVLPLIDQLLDVLESAHAKGIVHRDLKPENLFLTNQGQLKVLDFGIARLRELSAHSASSTRAGSVLGTPAFMAPEQALGKWEELDGRCDLWAVGATLFTMISGQFVHSAENVQTQLVLSATQRARPISEVAKGISPALALVVDRALAFDKSERFPDARSMREALRRAAQNPEDLEGLRLATRSLAQAHEMHGPTLLATPLPSSLSTQPNVSLSTPRAVAHSAQDFSQASPKRRWPFFAAGIAAVLLAVSVVGVRSRSTPLAEPQAATQPTQTVPAPRPLPNPEPIAPTAQIEAVVSPPSPSPSTSSDIARSTKRPSSTLRPSSKPESSARPTISALRPESTAKPEPPENPFDRRH